MGLEGVTRERAITASTVIQTVSQYLRLKQHQESLETYFRDHPPKTLAHATVTIAELTGIVRSREQVRHFLKSMGMRCRRVGLIPAKADPEAQEEFLKKN